VRQIDAHYVVSPGLGVWLTMGYESLADEPVIHKTYMLHTAVRFSKPAAGSYDISQERSAVIDMASQCLHAAERYCPGSRMSTGLRDDALLVISPARGHEIVEQLLTEVARGDQPDPPPTPSPSDLPRQDLERRLDSPIQCQFRDQLFLDVAAALTQQSGVNIGFDPRDLLQGPKTRLSLEIGDATLKFALEQLAARSGLGRPVPEPGRGVWLPARKASARIPESGELFWNRAVVRSYYVKPLIRRMGAFKLIELVHQNVTPGEWVEFGPVVGYHPAGRLIVFHDQEGQQQAAEYLSTAAAVIGRP
jgi:hypothetical protein